MPDECRPTKPEKKNRNLEGRLKRRGLEVEDASSPEPPWGSELTTSSSRLRARVCETALRDKPWGGGAEGSIQLGGGCGYGKRGE